MTVTYIESNAHGRVSCPNCGENNWLRDQSDVDAIALHTDPRSKVGNLGCNHCGHSWNPTP